MASAPAGHGVARLRGLLPVGIGAAVALIGVLVFTILTPAPKPLTQQDVDQAIASALASVTPPPAYSQVVYQQSSRRSCSCASPA
jgi:hypothetical protein